MGKPKIPTDREILQKIFDRYYENYAEFSREAPCRSAKIYVPIDCSEVSRNFGIDVDIVFGRLYYHLEKKFGYTQPDGLKVHFFMLKAGSDSHCVNFPLLTSALAGLHEEHRKQTWAVGFAIASLIVSIVSVVISIWGKA